MADQLLQQLIQTTHETIFRMEAMDLVTPPVSPVPSLHSPEEPSPNQPDSIATPPDWQISPPDTRSLVRENGAIRRDRRCNIGLYRRCVENQARNLVGSLWSMSPTDSGFYGTVNIEKEPVAHEFAQMFCNRGSSRDHLVIWTSVSGKEGRAFGYSVAVKFHGEQWKFKLGLAENPRGVDHGHMHAIKLALEQAVRHVRAYPPPSPSSMNVKIFSDSRTVLKKIMSLPFIAAHGTMQALGEVLDTLQDIAQLSETLSALGANLELFWAPEAGKTAGEMLAKSAATYALAHPNESAEEDSTVAELGTFQDEMATSAGLSGSRLRIEVKYETCDSESSDGNMSDVAERGSDVPEVNETEMDVGDVERTKVVEEEVEKQRKASKHSWWERLACLKRSS